MLADSFVNIPQLMRLLLLLTQVRASARTFRHNHKGVLPPAT